MTTHPWRPPQITPSVENGRQRALADFPNASRGSHDHHIGLASRQLRQKSWQAHGVADDHQNAVGSRGVWHWVQYRALYDVAPAESWLCLRVSGALNASVCAPWLSGAALEKRVLPLDAPRAGCRAFSMVIFAPTPGVLVGRSRHGSSARATQRRRASRPSAFQVSGLCFHGFPRGDAPP